jgi:hypothetical protein
MNILQKFKRFAEYAIIFFLSYLSDDVSKKMYMISKQYDC